MYPTARPLWEPNVWYLRQFWDERLNIDNPYSVPFTWVSQVCNCCQLFSECVKFIVKCKAKWEISPTAHPLWEPNAWYIRRIWDEHLKIDIPYRYSNSSVPIIEVKLIVLKRMWQNHGKIQCKLSANLYCTPSMGAKCVIHSHFVRWASQNWHTLQRSRTMGANYQSKTDSCKANVTKSL